MAGKPTVKKEAFAMAVVETGNQSEAYRRAYNASRMKPETIARKASELMKDGYVTARVDELRQEIRDGYEITLQGQIEEYRDILTEAKRIGSELQVNADGTFDNTMGSIKDKVDSVVKVLARLDKIGGLEQQEKDNGPREIKITYIDQRMLQL